MKVCVLAWSVYETDARIRKYSEALTERGDSVDVIALSPDDRNKIPTKYSLQKVTVYEVLKRFPERRSIDYLIAVLKFFFISSYYITKKHVINRYDLIHVHSPPDFEVFAAFLPKLLGAKIVLDIHDPVPDFFAAKFGSENNNVYIKLLNLLERISAKFADHVITVTDYWKDVISKRSHIPDRKISVIVNLPDTRLFNPKKFTKKEKSNRNFSLLYPGTLNKHCGLDIAIKAINLVKKEIPSIKFLIYGKGSEYNRLQLIVDDLGLEDFVFFHNHVSWEIIPKIVNDADIGIALLSGHGEYSQQALNVKLFEFLAMGLPVVATRTKALRYYIDKDIVMLSEPNDPNDVARCIRELYYNSNKRRELKRNGLKFIKKNNWELQMIDFLNIIDKLVLY